MLHERTTGIANQRRLVPRCVRGPVIGEQVGLYRIVRQLGQGGMGAVYLAEHARIGSRKVVKVLLPELSHNPQIVQRFENEARAAARLQHRNIIKIDDFGQLASGQWYILMPYLEGASLEAFLESHGKLTTHQALHLLVQICAALQAAHDAGIVHRDLKPGNIFLSHTEDNLRFVTLLDFGIAKLGERTDGMATQTGAVFGTPAYMAVEQLEDASRADARSDLYALGVIAYQLVTGTLPFGSASGAVLYNKQITSRPARPAGVPYEWAELLLRALAVRPIDRPQSARAFAIALAAVTPADPPFEPSGHEILLSVARELVTAAPPEAETVRHAEPSEVPVAQVWAPPGPASARLSASAPVSMAQPVTTMSAMSSSHTPPAQRPGRWRWLGALVSLVLVGAVVGGVVLERRRSAPLPAAEGPAPTEQAPVSAAPPAGNSPVAVAAAPRGTAAAPPGAAAAPPPLPAEIEVILDSYPRRAMLWADGRALGKAPQTVRAPVGSVLRVRAELAGYVSLARDVTIGPEPETAVMSLVRVRSGSKTAVKKASARPFDPDAAGGE